MVPPLSIFGFDDAAALGAAGIELIPSTEIEQAVRAAGSEGTALVRLRPEEISRLALLKPLGHRVAVVIDGASSPLLRQVAQLDFQGSIAFCAQPPTPLDLQRLVEGQLRPEVMGLARCLAAGATIERVTLTDSSLRGETFDALDRFFADKGLPTRLVSRLLTAADEFITNAFYNAPVDGAGRRINARVARVDRVVADREHPVEMSYGTDGVTSGVAVLDHYGALDAKTLLKHLADGYEPTTVSFSTSGASLGLATALRSSTQALFTLLPRRATECISLIDTTGGFRQAMARGHSVQLVQGALTPAG